MRKILVTGGAGYIGSVLVRKLLADGKRVRVFDNLWYGRESIGGLDVELTEGDIRSPEECAAAVDGIDSIVHLAGIAEDRGCELDEKVTHDINVQGTRNLVLAAEKFGAERFIYASSSSVYGVNMATKVTEKTQTNPINAYGKSKVESERIVLEDASDELMTACVRCATVCGVSGRMRGDVVVNALTLSALTKDKMVVYGGSQIRPNIHVDVITDLYVQLLDEPKKLINRQVFNAGFENLSVLEIAKRVKRFLPSSEIAVNKSVTDPRSYTLCSDKLTSTLGFFPKKYVNDAILDIITTYQKAQAPFDKIRNCDDSRLWNIRWIKEGKLI